MCLEVLPIAGHCCPPTGSAHIGWAAATEPRDGINQVFLHLCAEAHAAHELLQEPAVLHLSVGAGGVHSSPLPHDDRRVGHAADDFGGRLERRQLLEKKRAFREFSLCARRTDTPIPQVQG